MSSGPGRPTRWDRPAAGLRYLILTGGVIGAIGVVGWAISWPLLTAALGPTAYVFAAHPDSPSARARNALVGHAVAVGAGVGALAVFGLWHHPAVSSTGTVTLPQACAAAVAVGVSMLVCELFDSHHAPAAATALFISTGLARPGRPLAGLVVGLAMVISLGPVIGRVPGAREAARRTQQA